MKFSHKSLRHLAALAALGCALHAQAQTAYQADEGARVRAVAADAYVYGLPFVMTYAAIHAFAIDRESSQFKAPLNQLYYAKDLFTPKDRAVVSPNSDTPYSLAVLDLRAEPMVISVPAIDPKRYYSVMLCDGKSYNYGIFGSIVTDGEPGDYLVVGPDWQGETPKGIRKVYRSGTQQSLMTIRTQLFRPDDMENVRQIVKGYRIEPLSAWLHQPAPAPVPAIDYPKINNELARKNFFAYLDFALQMAPATEDEKAMRAELASIGIGNGKFDAYTKLAAAYGKDLQAGVKDGDARVDQAIANFGRKVNGWNMFLKAGGDRARFAGDWAERAAFVKVGIYGLDASEVIYGFGRTLPDGETLDASAHHYTLTFAAGALPPADAFWSVTLYDGKTQLLAENPINRYLINSPMLPALKRNADGSITLHIQKESPGPDLESNWLPAPDGPFNLALRAYGPRPELRNGSWSPPPIVRVD